VTQSLHISKSAEHDAKEPGQPVVTKDIAKQLFREGRELRQEFRRRIESMWNISSEQRHIRTR
jgi:hypothetical protein